MNLILDKLVNLMDSKNIVKINDLNYVFENNNIYNFVTKYEKITDKCIYINEKIPLDYILHPHKIGLFIICDVNVINILNGLKYVIKNQQVGCFFISIDIYNLKNFIYLEPIFNLIDDNYNIYIIKNSLLSLKIKNFQICDYVDKISFDNIYLIYQENIYHFDNDIYLLITTQKFELI